LVIKKGKRRNLQRYQCHACGQNFQNKRRIERAQIRLWHQYVWRKQNTKELAKDHNRSIAWVRRRLDEISIKQRLPVPRSIVLATDAVFWGRYYGVAIARDPHLKENLYWIEIRQETPAVYSFIRYQLEKRGFKIRAVVADGKKGVREVFFGLPFQLCHFHQLKTIKRYLTSRPKLEAGQELRNIALTLTKTTEDKFKKDLDIWFKKWNIFLKEKTLNHETNRYFFTHKKLRSAYRSFQTNLPPFLLISNTQS